MGFIGTIPKRIWNIALEIAKEEPYPVKQPENCHYIILSHTTDKQLIVLSGVLRRQHIELHITNVIHPSDLKNIITPDQNTIYKANISAWTLISKALAQFLHTRSIDKQP